MCTYLEDFKRDPTSAMPYLTFTIFDDMVEKKQVALIRGEVSNNMTVAEAERYVTSNRIHDDDDDDSNVMMQNLGAH